MEIEWILERYKPAISGMKERTTSRRSGSDERKVSYSQLQSGSSPEPENGEDVREDETASYAVREDRRDCAGESESARDEIGLVSSDSGSGLGKSDDKRWIRERALEIDSHQECIGSLLLLLAVVAVVVLWLLLRWEEEEVVEEEEGDPPEMWWRKSI